MEPREADHRNQVGTVKILFRTALMVSKINVGDLWHFGTDPNADPRIRTSDQQIQMRIREAQKHTYPDGFRTLVHLHNSSKIKSHKEVTKQ